MIAFVDSFDAPLPGGIQVAIASNGYFVAQFITNSAGAIPLVASVGEVYEANFLGYRAPTTTIAFAGANDPQTVLIAGYVVPPAYVPPAPAAAATSVPLANPAATRTDIALPYGGKIQLTPNGDLAIVQDVPSDPACTTQHVIHDVQYSPRLRDAHNQPIAAPDDPIHPDRGSGARALLGQPNNEATRATLRSNVMRTLAVCDGVSNDPAPTITVVALDRRTIEMDIDAFTTSGEPLAIPGIALTA